MHRIKVSVRNQQHEVPISISLSSVRAVVAEVLCFENVSVEAVSVRFVSDSTMKRLHGVFFNDTSSTDCISIPLDADFSIPVPYRHLGDILICPKTALNYVQNDTSAFWNELTLYLIHSLLHLLGYDDITEKLQQTMQKEEKRVMENLIKKGLLLSGTFRSS